MTPIYALPDDDERRILWQERLSASDKRSHASGLRKKPVYKSRRCRMCPARFVPAAGNQVDCSRACREAARKRQLLIADGRYKRKQRARRPVAA